MSRQSNPRQEWLDHLHESRQWERLEKLARESLQADPDDVRAQGHLAWALLRTGRVEEIAPHVRAILNANAESISGRQLAAIHAVDTGAPERAWSHLDTALELAPDAAPLHHLAAVVHCRQNSLAKAKAAIAKAKSLDPESPAIARLYIDLHHAANDNTRRAWERLAKLEEVLAVNPEAAEIHRSMGKVFLKELKLPRQAEECFRRCLALNPNQKDVQELLWQAVQSRSTIFSTLRLPVTALRVAKVKDWQLLVLLVTPLAGAVIWWVVCAALFSPAAFAYERLVMSDIRQRSSRPRWLRGLERWPMWLRLTLCVILIVGFWTLLLQALGVRWPQPLVAPLLIFFFHWLFVVILRGAHVLLSAGGRWQARRRSASPAVSDLPTVAKD